MLMQKNIPRNQVMQPIGLYPLKSCARRHPLGVKKLVAVVGASFNL